MPLRQRKNWKCRIGLHDFPDDHLARFMGDCLPCRAGCGKAVQVGYDGMEVTHRVVPIQGRTKQIIEARYGVAVYPAGHPANPPFTEPLDD